MERKESIARDNILTQQVKNESKKEEQIVTDNYLRYNYFRSTQTFFSRIYSGRHAHECSQSHEYAK